MNSRQRVIATLERTGPDRVPTCDAFWEDTITRWEGEGLPRGVAPADYFDFDIRLMSIDPSPRFPAELLAEDGEMITVRDRFGYVARKHRHKSRTIDYLSHPVGSREDWQAVRQRFTMSPGGPARIDTLGYPFRLEPDITWDQARGKCAALRDADKYILAHAYGPNEAAWRLRGFTQLMYDLADDPQFIAEIAGAYVEFLIAVIDRCIEERVVPDGFMMIEDLGCARGMLFSPEVWRRIHKPLTARLGDFLRSRGISFWMHCCGNAEAIFEDLIECGLAVMQPLEAKAGLDVRTLKGRYGERLTFFGNINVMTMARSAAAVEEEIRDKLAAFKDSGGGYIYHSDHSVPPEISFERYRFVMDWVRRYGACA